MIAELVPLPATGRVFRSTRRIRLSDRDAAGRLRLDSVARFLQDVAMDDVDETGWGAPEHLWVMRHIRIEIVSPPIEDDYVELATWCSGTARVAAGRRMSLLGDSGGRIELDSAWIHLGPDARPARIDGFEQYAEAAGGHVVSTRLELQVPPTAEKRIPWPLRATDIDLLGHVNNAAYWHAVEERLLARDLDLRRPIRARLDHRHAIDFGDDVSLGEMIDDMRLGVTFNVGNVASAVAWIETTW
ncbi:acyl-[acyl-carrier-protein] thioesterase [soil metagenome]